MEDTLVDLHRQLFETFKALGDRTLKGAALTEEINRADARGRAAQKILNADSLLLQAAVAADRAAEYLDLPFLPDDYSAPAKKTARSHRPGIRPPLINRRPYDE